MFSLRTRALFALGTLVLTASLVALPTRVTLARQAPNGYSPEAVKKAVGAKATAIVAALKANDTKTLASFVHPTKGVKFSLYVHVNPSDKTFSKAKVASLKTDKTVYLWGDQDGSGDAIKLTWADFRKKYLWRKDFTTAPTILYHRIRRRGNSVNTLNRDYHGAVFVEYYVPAKTPDGMDWADLWLVFEKTDKGFYLVGISQDEWTI